jgi:membrane protein
VAFWSRWADWASTSESVPATWLRAARAALFGEMPELAAGTAFFALLSTVPLLAAVVAIYGAVADPYQIRSHLASLSEVLPPDVLAFVGEQLERQASRGSSEAGATIITSVAVALYSARGGSDALIDVLNRAYRVREKRSTLRRVAMTIGMAAGVLIGLMVIFAVVVGLPGVFALFHLQGLGLVHWLRWPVLMIIIFGALLALYRFAPSPRPLVARHLWPGAAIGTLLLVVVSWGLSLWVDRVADYDLVYGAFGSVIVVLLWFYLSVLAIVLGGFVNAELERHAGAPAPDREMY